MMPQVLGQPAPSPAQLGCRSFVRFTKGRTSRSICQRRQAQPLPTGSAKERIPTSHQQQQAGTHHRMELVT